MYGVLCFGTCIPPHETRHTNHSNMTRLSRILIGYMVLAFSWWAFHLWGQNERLFEAEKELLEVRFSHNNRGVNLSQMQETAEYQRIVRERQKRRRMIVSEGLFFVLCLAYGLYSINRSANREVKLARQRRNFLLSITHELKSPIAALRLVLETIGKRDLQREQLNTLTANGLKDATRLQQLVEDLLLAARLDDNWQPLHEPVDLAALVHDCAARLRVRFPQANIQAQVAEDLPPIQADRSGLTAIIQNLIENAVKYSPEGSPVSIGAERLGTKFRIQVADQGQGIPDSEKRAVFEKFYRLGNEETRRTTGTGLGLYIVEQVLRAHGGSVQVTDNQPRGTVFSIEI